MKEITPSFLETLEKHNLDLKRKPTQTLQINTGYLCNQACKHCHLEAGPHRTEIMDKNTIDQIIDFQKKCNFKNVDITGGAPEMNPDIVYLVKNIAPLAKTIIFRSNLSALFDLEDKRLIETLKANNVNIVSSFPSLNHAQSDAQRGKGIFDKSLQALKMLNKNGYGQKESGLELNLVSNPSGAFLPVAQEATEKRYRDVLKKKWGIVFNNAYSFANIPLGRFKEWLIQSKNFDAYISKLYQNFNPCTINDLMCTNMISVSWDGFLFDCDFNLSVDAPKGGEKLHISQVDDCNFENDSIAVDNHCYACTAGSGFT